METIIIADQTDHGVCNFLVYSLNYMNSAPVAIYLFWIHNKCAQFITEKRMNTSIIYLYT